MITPAQILSYKTKMQTILSKEKKMVFSQYMGKEQAKELMSSKCSFMTQFANMKEKCLFVSQIPKARVKSSLKQKKITVQRTRLIKKKVVVIIKNKEIIMETMEPLKAAMNMMNMTLTNMKKNMMIMKDKGINGGKNIGKLKDSKMKRTSKKMISKQDLKEKQIW